MTVHHFVFAKFRPHLTLRERFAAFAHVDALLSAAVSRVDALSGACGVPGLRAWNTGPPVHAGRAEGKDFGFTAEFEDWQAFRDSLPHEWHHEIYRFVKSVTEGDFFIYQIDTEAWRVRRNLQVDEFARRAVADERAAREADKHAARGADARWEETEGADRVEEQRHVLDAEVQRPELDTSPGNDDEHPAPHQTPRQIRRKFEDRRWQVQLGSLPHPRARL
ncbi:hypothetical protein BD626DRAFT_575275 [Schizophyllum amplum]|uniref:Stress-response A/B barrel domain-containing protein n=1 Tax=Schizophyllum amplum TaxID=97359 RepID=A0A550BW16_9AGAR|nr:hypothetical protein BD626DRAFT_575275 [Auriculariopsis ampla]